MNPARRVKQRLKNLQSMAFREACRRNGVAFALPAYLGRPSSADE